MLEGMKTTDRQQRINEQGTRAGLDGFSLAAENVEARAEQCPIPIGVAATRWIYQLWVSHYLRSPLAQQRAQELREKVEARERAAAENGNNSTRDDGEVDPHPVVGSVAHVSSRKDGE